MDFLYNTVFALFLYFPEDKSEYIPAAITSVIFIIGAVLTMRFIIAYSHKEALKTKELEEEITRRNQRNHDSVK
ncbi:hypothetical protein ELQ35_19015 [Peribacillus cavernae]|uniref:Uncharacterized protein n=1 Tax=Peribacillus cavernae TaxID=1674310 RepID=A0A3S0TRN9_9BACI|nr:hypothetical protein [Peribacillus cavernae]MDQ0219622.1 uncharacterized membrane protein YciS (DUF1049 family) [Peribacillus cavernae]RUQ25909.1 hypothetical protein ELQ35_19015 [Peribacillus cavernae]